MYGSSLVLCYPALGLSKRRLPLSLTLPVLSYLSLEQLMAVMSSPVCMILRLTAINSRFAGATLPHGMVKAGMDTDAPGNVYSGHFY